MSPIAKVFADLGSMGLWQLLLAFVACMAYALAQGRLFGRRGNRVAWAAAFGAAAAFVATSADWTGAVVLVAIAIAGLGSFAGLVWLTSRLFGIDRTPPLAPADSAFAADATAAPPAAGTDGPPPLGGRAVST
ncbi:MAG TPA: hypothetical protein VNU71_02775 [Burkholderiaceae bacterium]|nr:hypothetical protein [Burkholderiaceae bacterium]